eukprot:scaffold28483_cov43-Prasinocladus_malaysianus.AAC.1
MEQRHLAQFRGWEGPKVTLPRGRLGPKGGVVGFCVGERQPEVDLARLVAILDVAVDPPVLQTRARLQPHAGRHELGLEVRAADLAHKRLVDPQEAIVVILHGLIESLSHLEAAKYTRLGQEILQAEPLLGVVGIAAGRRVGGEAPQLWRACQKVDGGFVEREGGRVESQQAMGSQAPRQHLLSRPIDIEYTKMG